MIKEAYCSYNISKLLKEKGFDEECTHYYDMDDGIEYTNGARVINSSTETYCTSPTHQIACAWLREIHNIHIEIYVIKNYDKKICKYTYTIMDLNFPGSDDGIDCCNEYKTYEQACEAAIKYCLERLVW